MPQRRVLPAQQRFGTGHRAAAEAELRLQDEAEFVALDRVGERLFGIEPMLMLLRQCNR